ncbi:hypothetical protein [Desulfofustis limnaeus]|uniref:hypothetical protein n=1 Tax=Desulfofustis limnaeus TaxID=2740163 RepID=UPI0024DF9B66|nr:hypothetical protein [Desulfofustis limnaeus]
MSEAKVISNPDEICLFGSSRISFEPQRGQTFLKRRFALERTVFANLYQRFRFIGVAMIIGEESPHCLFRRHILPLRRVTVIDQVTRKEFKLFMP